MKIEAIHCLYWKIGIPIRELKRYGWEIGPGLEGYRAVYVYTAGNEFGSTGDQAQFPEIKYFGVRTAKGKIAAHAYKNWEHLLGILQRVLDDCGHAKHFGEAYDNDHSLLSALVFGMGWAEDVFLMPGYRYEESDMWLDASKIKSKLARHPKKVIVVRRETWRGNENISLTSLKRYKDIPYIPKEFEPDDRLEFTRVYYPVW